MHYKPFPDILKKFISREGRHVRQLSQLSAKEFGTHHQIPPATISRWLRGEVTKPRTWHDIVKLAAILCLSEVEADELLNAAGYPSITTLRKRSQSESDHTLLSHWNQAEQPSSSHTPFQPPPDLPSFVGHNPLLNEITKLIITQPSSPILCLQGMGGSGKTALATHLSYQLRSYFPDGTLWIQVDQTDPMSALNSLATAYGEDISQYQNIGCRSSQVRKILAQKQALIVLDHVTKDDEVRYLLPPTGSCKVLITTRRHDLAIADQGHRFDVQPFMQGNEDSLSLFIQILGEDTVLHDKETFIAISNQLGHLPLAISIAANRIKHEPNWTPKDFLQQIQQSKNKFIELVRGDQHLYTVFDRSYHFLPQYLQIIFARLSLFKGRDFTAYKTALNLGISVEEAANILRQLSNRSLIQTIGADHYCLHPLLHEYSQVKLAQIVSASTNTMKILPMRYLHSNDLIEQIEYDNIALSTKHKLSKNTGIIDSYEWVTESTNRKVNEPAQDDGAREVAMELKSRVV